MDKNRSECCGELEKYFSNCYATARTISTQRILEILGVSKWTAYEIIKKLANHEKIEVQDNEKIRKKYIVKTEVTKSDIFKVIAGVKLNSVPVVHKPTQKRKADKKKQTQKKILTSIKELLKKHNVITIKMIAENAKLKPQTLRGHYYGFILQNCKNLLPKITDTLDDNGEKMTEAQQEKLKSFMDIPDKALGIGLENYNRR